MSQSVIEHLEEAEAALMSWVSRLSALPDVEITEQELMVTDDDLMPMLLAVLRHVSRAAGQLQAEALFTLSPLPPDPNWRCWRGYPPFCSALDPFAHEQGYGCGLGAPRSPRGPDEQT